MVTIGTDGHVSRIQVISGHPLMVPPSLEAVKQWVFAPIPAAGTTEIQVPFVLPPGSVSGGEPLAMGGKKGGTPAQPTIRIGPAVQASKLINRVEPVYPQQAREAGIEGSVTMEVLIGEDGHVQTVTPREGHPALVAAATDAVRQWVYQPTRIKMDPTGTVESGTLCSVITTVTVTFP
jgi:TonB family protein